MREIQMRLKSLFAGLATLALSAGTAGAEVISFDLDASDTTTVYSGEFDGNVNGTWIAGLTGEVAFSLVSKAGADWTIEFWLENTSTVDSTITVFAFDSDPDISAASSVAGDWDVFVLGGALPNGFGSVELCIKETGNTNNCQAGQDGLDDGVGAAHFTVQFTTDDATATNFMMANFGVRYQSITGLGTTCGTEDCTSGTGMLIPEPATWIMMIVGFAGIGTALRYRRRQEYGAIAA